MNRLIISRLTSPRGLVASRRIVRDIVASTLLMATQAAGAYAVPSPDASAAFADWFRNLTVPGIPGAPRCTLGWWMPNGAKGRGTMRHG